MIGIDVGFGYTKIYAGNGENDKTIFPSVYAKYRERFELISADQLAAIDLNRLEVVLNGSKYIIGELAVKEAGTTTFDKSNFTRHLICMLTGISITKGDYIGDIVMGLPISDMDIKERMQALAGNYEFGLSNKIFNIKIENIRVVPQGVATFYDAIIDDTGVINDDLNAFKRVGIIDIGEKTVDFVSLNDSEIVIAESGSIDWGISTIYKRLCPILQKKCKINVLPYQVKQYQNKITTEFETEYQFLADEILDHISAWWNYQEFDKILITGGSSSKLRPYFSKRINNCYVVADAQFSNARGYYKCGLVMGQKQPE